MPYLRSTRYEPTYYYDAFTPKEMLSWSEIVATLGDMRRGLKALHQERGSGKHCFDLEPGCVDLRKPGQKTTAS